ncbi:MULTISPECIES: ATP adenylyltransferase family protein [Cyanophyceae]|uniref:Phosphorylase n=1 Tax=Leptolyngbya subtilissima DQ-A4 TaxID=2933933 RepID=A0ABV0K2M9_9CYAN|nr:phosphorylase [Nodosilinea sp. FACHB-141]MBD2113007.1 phosphorylase [Nodosilinea sp. FACHB-141]
MEHFPEVELAPGALWSKIQQQTRHAQSCGALQPIDTRYEFLEQGGMRFLVRILANLARKEKADLAQQSQQRMGKPVNPFLPYDPDLFVANLSATHLCLLNKYNVVDHHILIVTRAYEDQDSWLTLADFEALATCMADIDGLAFYNGGRLAGASQRHKHLQLVPPPLCPDRGPLPLATVVADLALKPTSAPVASPRLPFHHAIAALQEGAFPKGKTLLETYLALLTHLGVDWSQPPQAFPYNLLITREWMMAVARRQDHYQSIPVNSLGFAGSLLVKNPEQLDLLKAFGPMTVLQQVACSR